MKTIFTIIMLSVSFLAIAQERKEMEPIHKSTNAEWKEGILKDGASSHAGRSGKENFPDIWSYWYIQSGNKPANFKLAPMTFNVEKSKSWKRAYWEVPGLAGTPSITGVFGYIAKTSAAQGMGIAFSNPYPHTISVAVEGNLRYYKTTKPYQILLFKRTFEGKIVTKILKSSLQKDSTYSIEEKKKDGSLNLIYYFRLGVDCRLAPKEKIFLMIYDPSVAVGERSVGGWELRFCLDVGQGKTYRPTFIITNSNKK